ncbi:hypothetical protein HY251_04110 [bacterium]|nr:hypothetical protein [bacterium]
MPDQKDRKNEPTPKPKAGVGARLGRMLLVFVVLVAAGALGAYSVKLGSPPWKWSNDDWASFLQFSKEKASTAKERISDATKELIDKAPGIIRRIEEKIGAKPPSTANNAAPPDSKGTGGTTPAADDQLEYKLGLQAMRLGIEHYRNSTDDPNEITLAKKCFEEAKDHLTKAAKEAKDDSARKEIEQDLKDTNRYIDDCRARSKS